MIHVFKDHHPPTRGGIEQHVQDVVHGLSDLDTAVLTSSRSRRLVVDDDAGVTVVRAPELGRILSSPVTPSWPAEARRLRPDLLHLHLPNPTAEVAFLARPAPCPVVVTYHAANPRTGASPAATAARRLLAPAADRVQGALLRRAARIVVSSPPLAELPILRPHRDRVRVVPFGVEPDAWGRRPDQADAISSRYPGPLVIFLGRRVHYKGLDVLARAADGLEATVLVVGDGPIRPVAPLIAVGGVDDADRPAYLHAADVFVLPSTGPAETFGIAMLEAMACGTPVVSTDVGTGTSWVNDHGVTGLVVGPGDATALRAALGHLIRDVALRRRMGRAARARVASSFTRTGMLEGLRRVYREVLGT